MKNIKEFYLKEKERLIEIFKQKKCTNIKFYTGYYYFFGFFNAPNGQLYYYYSYDLRDGYNKLLFIKKVKDENNNKKKYEFIVKNDYKSLMEFKFN